MIQTMGTTPLNERTQRSSLAYVCVALVFGVLFCVALTSSVFLTLSKVYASMTPVKPVSVVQPERHVQAKLDIVINQAGMQKDWPAYSPTRLVVPANSLVTVTLRDYDLGDTAMPKNSPFTTVQGTVGNAATADSHSYTSLTPDKIAHTFTIMQLNINVPLPGDGAKGTDYDTITFTFHTGKAGTYTFQCFDPCGTGSTGWEGPMMTKGYMVGTLVVQ